MTTSKSSPRSVPTLTEVVHVGQPKTSIAIDSNQLMKDVLRLIKPRLEQQLRASLQVVLDRHLQTWASQIQKELETTVQAAVAQAIGEKALPAAGTRIRQADDAERRKA